MRYLAIVLALPVVAAACGDDTDGDSGGPCALGGCPTGGVSGAGGADCRVTPCPQAEELEEQMVCDHAKWQCVPASGDCMNDEQCPLMFPEARKNRPRCISEGSCQFPIPMSPTDLTDAPGGVEVVSPEPGYPFASSRDLAIKASGPEGVYVFVVTGEKPQRLRELSESALWVATLTNAGTARWQDGSAPADGAGRMDLPENKLLYATVLVYDPARLVASSNVIPFGVAVAWKNAGDPCDDPGVVEGDCAHPEYYQACKTDGLCGILCASNFDCTSKMTDTACDPPDADGHRFCGPR